MQELEDTLEIHIPKLENANIPSKFMLISLCQYFYKVFAKILVNRLKKIIVIIVGEEQRAIVPERSFSGNFLVV